jgi:uncharacterized pyridoxamine 5'-phosphate oxidase family protein
MTAEQIFELISKHPAFYMATIERNEPRVRGMLLYKADQEGIVFHTGTMKEVYRQVLENPRTELCFHTGTMQIRIRGELQVVEDESVKDEISKHPSRKFLTAWRESGPLQNFYDTFVVFKLQKGRATTWTIETNFDPKAFIQL